ISCTADVRTAMLACSAGPAGTRVRGDIIGGQRVNVFLQSSPGVYNAADSTLTTSVTVQNLLVQRMGSDGVTVSGVKVFFNDGPNTTGGSGVVEVLNGDGLDTFTGSNQPYFSYPQAIGADSVSAARQWKFKVPPSATKFTFTVYVSAPLVPAIVFDMAVSGNRDIYRMGIDGKDLKRLTTSGSTDLTPTVMNGHVVFTSYRDGNAELYSVPLRGGTETRLTGTSVGETSPSLSPDGTRLAFVRPFGAGTRVYFAALDSSATVLDTAHVTAANTLASSDAIESTPTWASSTRLAFGSTASASSDIYQVVTVPGVALMLAGGRFADVEPAWSPDGTQVAFASNRSGDTELYLVDATTGVVTRVTTRTGSDGAPSWFKDGRIVYTCTQGTTLRLCIIDPANPAGAALITTPNAADHASAVRF
ncbi:MAG TPA: hypothetical protein VF705_09610, partial [Longimicrobium sp.]